MGGQQLTNLGSIGKNTATVASIVRPMGPPWWWNPLNHAVGVKSYGATGPQAVVGAYASGAVPAELVPVVVADFGQVGGGVAIY